MPEYYQTTFVREVVPDADVTPLELLLLSRVFHAEHLPAGWHFYAKKSLPCFFYLGRMEIESALAASHHTESTANGVVAAQLAVTPPEATSVMIDLMETSWEFLFQDIVRRSSKLRYISAVMTLTCSEIREDGFGGVAWVITADKVLAKSTDDIITEFLREEQIPWARRFPPETWKSPLDRP